MDCLKVFDVDGIVLPYEKKKLMVVPAALKGVRLKPTGKLANLGRLAHLNSLKVPAVTASLDEERQEKVEIHYREEKQLVRLWKQKCGEENYTYTEVVLKSHGLLI